MAWLEVVPGIRIGAGPPLNLASVRFDESGSVPVAGRTKILDSVANWAC
jgi:hypothetical protein